MTYQLFLRKKVMKYPAPNFRFGDRVMSTSEYEGWRPQNNRRTWAVRCPLKKHRVFNGLTLREVYGALGIRISTLSMYEQGDRRCPTQVVVSLAKLFGVEATNLVVEYELWRALAPVG
jgi:hypothetical protein